MKTIAESDLYLKNAFLILVLASTFFVASCKETDEIQEEDTVTPFAMGVDLSYVNQILDFSGSFKENSVVKDPYSIFADRGATVARFRLFHNPTWTKEVYGAQGKQLYNDLNDVILGIQKAKSEGMTILLDFHYSDTWADPGSQVMPLAWKNKDFNAVNDSVYNYTYATLERLNSKGLMPEMVQIGNETNCGMLHPLGNVCSGAGWDKLAILLNSGIKAVRDVEKKENKKIKVMLHVSQPENVVQWFTKVVQAGVTDYDVLGFSYYSNWSDVPLNRLSLFVKNFKQIFKKEVMVLETAYPWTLDNADSYSNLLGQNALESGYPATRQGQKQYMIDLVQQVMDGGGTGVFYWEPAWITSEMRDLWGKGSSWENSALFDFTGNAHEGIDYLKYDYRKPN